MPNVHVKSTRYVIGVALPHDVKVKLQALARKEGESVSSLVRKIILEYVKTKSAEISLENFITQ